MMTTVSRARTGSNGEMDASNTPLTHRSALADAETRADRSIISTSKVLYHVSRRGP